LLPEERNAKTAKDAKKRECWACRVNFYSAPVAPDGSNHALDDVA